MRAALFAGDLLLGEAAGELATRLSLAGLAMRCFVARLWRAMIVAFLTDRGLLEPGFGGGWDSFGRKSFVRM